MFLLHLQFTDIHADMYIPNTPVVRCICPHLLWKRPNCEDEYTHQHWTQHLRTFVDQAVPPFDGRNPAKQLIW